MPPWLVYLYQYFFENFSNIVSIIGTLVSIAGIIITIIFTDRAKKAADAAKDASEDTRSKIYHIEVSLVLHECINDTENLIRRVEVDNWEAVSDIASRVRKSLIMAKNSFTEATHTADLEAILVQMRIINEASDNARHGAKKPPNKPRFISSIRSQVDALTEIHRAIVSTINKKDVN